MFNYEYSDKEVLSIIKENKAIKGFLIALQDKTNIEQISFVGLSYRKSKKKLVIGIVFKKEAEISEKFRVDIKKMFNFGFNSSLRDNVILIFTNLISKPIC